MYVVKVGEGWSVASGPDTATWGAATKSDWADTTARAATNDAMCGNEVGPGVPCGGTLRMEPRMVENLHDRRMIKIRTIGCDVCGGMIVKVFIAGTRWYARGIGF